MPERIIYNWPTPCTWDAAPDEAEAQPPPLSPTSLAEALQALPSTDQWANQNVTADDDGAAVAGAILRGSAIAVSDGSFKNRFGTASLVLESTNGKHRVRANLCVPGHPSEHSSHRSELAGVVATLILNSFLKISFPRCEGG